MEKDLETLMSELETAAWNQGHAELHGLTSQQEQCCIAIEEVKQEIRELFTKGAEDGSTKRT